MTTEITHFTWRRGPKQGPNAKGKYFKRIDYGLVSFQKDGKEYDINLIISDKPYPHPYSSTKVVNQIPGGINVAGYDLYYPKDFKQQYEYSFALTQDYRKNQELKQKNKLEEKRQKAAMKTEKINTNIIITRPLFLSYSALKSNKAIMSFKYTYNDNSTKL